MKRASAGALIALSITLLALAMNLRGGGTGSFRPQAAEEIVAANAGDAGPGTLRDAILAADRLPAHAHILITAKRIAVESALPALINKHGIDIRVAPGAGTIDATGQTSGTVLQITSPSSALRDVHILNARGTAIVVDAPGVQLDSVAVSDSNVAVLLGAGARGCVIRASAFERNEIGVTMDVQVPDIFIVGTAFRANTRAGLWLVGSSEKEATKGPAARPVRLVDGIFEKNAFGAVIGNRPILIQKTRFIDSAQSAVLILGGTARVEDAEIRGSGANAISVSSGRGVVLQHNSLIDNPTTAIMVRDSDVLIERNTLLRNGFGIVAIISREPLSVVIADNLLTGTVGDALTLIGGTPDVRGNRILDNHGIGLRVLDLAMNGSQLKTEPRFEANVLKGNAVDAAVPGVYPLADAL